MMKRLLFLTGYYGSGKTEIALNLAIKEKVDYVVDLDVINPYFRSRESEELLKTNNIDVISSDKEHSKFTDLPYISGRVFLPFQKEDVRAIYDLGGNDLGAKLLRQFEEYENEIDLYLVVNVFRPETQTKEEIISLIKKIQVSSGRDVTGLINNSNLLKETTIQYVYEGELILKEVSNELNLPIVYTCISQRLVGEQHGFEGELLPLQIYLRKKWF
ncbi:MAG: ATP-binding protein [Firmicutes bacterium]|nr:ATP-binding protein [Bacillota bacterium]